MEVRHCEFVRNPGIADGLARRSIFVKTHRRLNEQGGLPPAFTGGLPESVQFRRSENNIFLPRCVSYKKGLGFRLPRAPLALDVAGLGQFTAKRSTRYD